MTEEVTKLGGSLRELLSRHGVDTQQIPDDEWQGLTEGFLTEAATARWVDEQLRQTGLRAADFRKGISMDLQPARELAAVWVGAARGLLANAENYAETVAYTDPAYDGKASYTMGMSIPELPERYSFTVQRVAPGKLTPHEARLRAEKAISDTWKWIGDVNDGLGYNTGDLGYLLENNGFPPPSEEG